MSYIKYEINVCRTCHATTPLHPLTDVNLLQVLQECTSVNTANSIVICSECHRILREFTDFRQKCSITNELLEKHTDQIKPERVVKCELDVKVEEAGDKRKLHTRKRKKDMCNDEPNLNESNDNEPDDDIDKYWFTCRVCGEKFPDKRALIVHVSKHFPTLDCAVCARTFQLRGQLFRHYERVHTDANPSIKCGECTFEYHSTRELDYHLATDHAQPQCPICGRVFDLKNFSLEKGQHLKVAHQIQRRSVATKLTRKKRNGVRQHLKKQFKCLQCTGDVRFGGGDELSQHMRDEHVKCEPQLSCAQCARTFYIIDQLSEHLLSEHPLDNYKCPHCLHPHTKMKYLKRHLRNAHSASAEHFECTICGKRMSSETSLKYHMASKHNCGSTDDFKTVCNICGKKFYHIKVHIDKVHAHGLDPTAKRFKCRICKDAFTTSSQVYTHQKKSHPHELANRAQTHTCALCGKGFPGAVNLYHHHKSFHNHDRSHKCSQCAKGFKKARMLMLHMRTHTGEKPYACATCDKRFGHLRTRDEHALIHTGEKLHKCDVCARDFRQRHALRTHVKLVHCKVKRETDWLDGGDVKMPQIAHAFTLQ